MEEWKDVGEVPKVGHSTFEEMTAAHTHRLFFLVFLEGRQTPVVIEHNMRSGTATLEVRGKPEKTWQVKNLIDAFKDAYNFVFESHKFTICLQADEDDE